MKVDEAQACDQGEEEWRDDHKDRMFRAKTSVAKKNTSTVNIRLPDTRIPDSSEYRTPKLSGIQMVENVLFLNGPFYV